MVQMFKKQVINGKEILVKAPRRASRGRMVHREYRVKVGAREFVIDSMLSINFTVYEADQTSTVLAIPKKLGEFTKLSDAMAFVAEVA